jgi:hypothetical protein
MGFQRTIVYAKMIAENAEKARLILRDIAMKTAVQSMQQRITAPMCVRE